MDDHWGCRLGSYAGPEARGISASTLNPDIQGQDYDISKSVLMEKGINDRDSQNNPILTFFGYDSEGKPIYAVLPEDIPPCRVCRPEQHQIHLRST